MTLPFLNPDTPDRIAERLAERLRETESRFQTMADHAPVLLWMAGTDANCNFFNAEWLKFTGRPMEHELGVGWAEGIHPEDFQDSMDTYIDCFNARRSFEMEYRLLRRDGEYRWILDRGTPRFAPDGKFEGFIGSCIDITDRKHMELELERAVRLRDEFLSIASHELKTPLTALKLQTQIVRNALDPKRSTSAETLSPEALDDLLEMTVRQINHLSELVEILLDVSRIGSGGLTLQPESVDLRLIVGQVLERLASQAQNARCEIHWDPGEWPIIGHWDGVRLAQVLNNLVGNALKYAAGAPLDVRLEVTEGNFARVTVRDHGPGIQPQDQERIFERFERAASHRNYGGLGLGLYIAKQIVLAHGGRLRVESAPAKGAAFIVELPLSPR
jgi:PAS domain S-box-containing protein